MIIMASEAHNLYLIEAKDYIGELQYLRIYGLETSRYTSRFKAVRDFAHCLDHAEECEGHGRPIYGES